MQTKLDTRLNKRATIFCLLKYTVAFNGSKISTVLKHNSIAQKTSIVFWCFFLLRHDKYNATFVSSHRETKRESIRMTLNTLYCERTKWQLPLFGIFSVSSLFRQLKNSDLSFSLCRMNILPGSRLKHLDKIMKMLTLPKNMVIAIHSMSPNSNCLWKFLAHLYCFRFVVLNLHCNYC